MLVLTKRSDSMKPWKPRVNFTVNYNPVRSVLPISRFECCFSIITVEFRPRQQIKPKKTWRLMDCLPPAFSHTSLNVCHTTYVNRMGLWNDKWYIYHPVLTTTLKVWRKYASDLKWQAIDSSLDMSSYNDIQDRASLIGYTIQGKMRKDLSWSLSANRLS